MAVGRTMPECRADNGTLAGAGTIAKLETADEEADVELEELDEGAAAA